MSHARWALAAVVALAAVGCGGGGRSITLYNGQHSQLTTALVKAFEQRSGITVKVRTNDSIVLADQLLEEGDASPADVFLSENSPELETLEARGLLAKLPATTLAQVPALHRSPGGRWVGMALRVSALVQNPAVRGAQPLPASILDLAKPEWAGKVAVAPADSDFPPVVGAVIATHGIAAARAWLAGLKRNAKAYDDDEGVVAAVNRGDVATGVINSYYWYRLRLESGAKAMHSSVSYFPGHDAGAIENVSGAGVVAATGHRADAEAFVRFLVSPAAQHIISAGDDFEYPARPGVPRNPALPSLGKVAPATLGAARLGNDQVAAKLIQASGLG